MISEIHTHENPILTREEAIEILKKAVGRSFY